MKSGLVQKTVSILRAVSVHSTGIGLSELSRATGIPKATCLRVLGVLESERLLVLDPATKRYGVAFGALTIFGRLLDADSAYAHVQRELHELVATTQETAGLDVLVDTAVVVVVQIQGPLLISQAPKPVPRSLPTWSTSTGKVLLASLDESELRTTHGAALKASARARGSATSLVDELAEIRACGFGLARDEMEEGAAAVAAPVRVDGAVVAAVWIGGPTFRITPERIESLAAEVMATAARTSEVLALSGGWITGPVPTSAALRRNVSLLDGSP